MSRLLLLASVFATILAPPSLADEPAYQRLKDVIYGRRYGTALTMDVFTPPNSTGAAVVFAVSGGWFSAPEMINPVVYAEFLKRGYTVFAVVHGSQPRFTIPEAIDDMHRSIRFIRHHAGKYGIDPERIGISGGSAGGHLSLIIGMSGRKGDPAAKDPVERESSRVAAVACYFPPTDFLNYGQPGRDVFTALGAELAPFKAPFDFVELDGKNRRLVLIADLDKRRGIARDISPVTHVTSDDPPALMLHGDADKLVPIQQAEVMERALKAAGVPVKVVVKAGQGHGWQDWIKDTAILADWFDQHLKAGKTAATKPGE